MRVVYKTKDERMQITFDGKGIEDVVTCLAQIQDILENTRCQACVDACRDDAHGTVLDRRVSGSYVFYAAKCQHPDCGAELALGKRKEESGGGLYTKRRQGKNDANPGASIEHDGWTWYKKEEHPQTQQQAAPVQPMAQPVTAPPVEDDSIPF